MTNPLRSLFERRSGAVGSSHELYELLSRGVRSLAGVDVSESTAMQVAAVQTCVDLISRTMASLPVDVYERIDARKRQPAAGHPLRRVLAKPNPWQTWPEWIGMQTAHVLLRGNAYSLVIRSTNTSDGSQQITELLPLHPDKVKVEQKPYPRLELDYTWTDRAGQAHTFTNSGRQGTAQVLHLKGLVTNGVTGRDVLSDARDVIGVALATQQHAANTWQRGGVPSVVLKHPKTLSDKAKTSLETHFQSAYGGGPNQSRVAVIEEGMDISTLSLTSEQLQFLETRKFTRGEIFGLFHVPPHMAGDTEKSTSWGTGIEQQQLGFLTFTMMPFIVGLEHRIDADLIANPTRFYAKVTTQGFLRGDSASRSLFYWRMFQMGVFSPNDILGFEDMNPYEGGDVRLTLTNMAPIGLLEDIHGNGGVPPGGSGDA